MSEYERLINNFDRNMVRIEERKEGRVIRIQYPDQSPGIAITTAGEACSQEEFYSASEGRRDYEDQLHAHDCFFLVYVVKGSNLEIVEGKRISVSERDLLLLTPYTRHHNLYTQESQILFIHIDTKVLFEILRPAMLENILFSDFFSDFIVDETVRKAVFFEGVASKARPILEHILKEYMDKQLLYHSYMRGLLTELFVELARNQSFKQYHYSDAMSEQMNTILRFITENYQDVTLQDVARHFGYNPAYLSHKIRQFSGRTYSQLLTDYRLNRAGILIREKRLSVEEVALDCGYRDVSAFYKAFVKKYHCSPRSLA